MTTGPSEEIAENAADGIGISEFPVTMAGRAGSEGALACR